VNSRMISRAEMLNCARSLVAAYILLASAMVTTTAAQNIEPLKEALQAAGYQLYIPPRANWGPGFVFTGDVARGRLTNVEEVCPNLYADLEAPQGAAIVLPNFNAKDSFTFGLALRFLKGLLGVDFDLDKIERERSINVRWQNLREMSYTHMDQWLENGEARPIARRCRLAVSDLLAKNQFADRVFAIVRAVAPESLIYDFSGAVNAQASTSAQLWQDAQGRAQGKAEIKNGTQLEIKQRLFVGYAPPAKLRDWLPTGQVTGDIVKVKGEASNVIIE
jgi:hypothetical protein